MVVQEREAREEVETSGCLQCGQAAKLKGQLRLGGKRTSHERGASKVAFFPLTVETTQNSHVEWGNQKEVFFEKKNVME